MTQIESETREKVRSLLKELFQFDTQDLDFGIYRIMNLKRKEIEEFIDEGLIAAAESEFTEYARSSEDELQKEVEKLRIAIVRDFGEGTIDGKGEVRKNEEAPKVKEYIRKKGELQNAGITQEQINDVFNHIYEFFSRYYDKGDFLSKRRFGGREKYFVPYNGEEVLLHWANRDQYYIKSGEYFNNYNFRVGGWRIVFALKEAEIALNNVKGEAKYFLLDDQEGMTLDEEKKELILHFNWRALCQDEKIKYGPRSTQEAITSGVVDRFFSEVGDKGPSKELGRKVEEETTLLEKHLSRYVKRNTTDYFIHKNLKAFLQWELDFYLKNEVFDLDEIEHMDERNIRLGRAKIRAIRNIGDKIIAHLAQIETFQKMMFEKTKFVLSTDYCITLDRVPVEFYSRIGENEKQVNEWRDFFKLDETTNGAFYRTQEKGTLSVEFLKSHPYLVLDSAFFDQDFKDRLLGFFSNLEEKVDGVLIKSENFQALKLLLNKYKGRVKCIYIDPPYNTGNDEFLYKDNYQHSSWLAMMFDRLLLARELLHPSGTIAVSIDSNEIEDLLKLLDLIFRNRRAIITVKRGSVTGPKVINPGVVNVSEYLVIYSKSDSDWIPNRVYRERKRDQRYSSFIINRDQDCSKWRFKSLLQAFAEHKRLRTTALKKSLGTNFARELDQYVFDHADAVVQTVALDDDKISKEARELKKRSKDNPSTIYHFQRGDYDDWYIVNGKRILFYSDRLVRMGSKLVPGELVTDIWDDTLPNDLHNEGRVTLKKGKKPEKLVGRLIELVSNEGDLVLDFFVGTGTACAAAQKRARLDMYFQNPTKFLNELNEWVFSETRSEEPFSAPNLKKVAYWMATGSGKTLIMHANFWQFLAYNKGAKMLDFENVILITPSDEMSKQHLEELKKSGISATLFQGDTGGYFEGARNVVKVISIHKLKLPEDKKGEGVTVDISSLGTRNLVLVDEGHKGQKSEDLKWKKTRERLAKDGFTFEYSATFGQAITSSNEETFREYSKAILFDYSYKYFYGDGYGKDFRILNLDAKTFTDKQVPILLLADALSFYEQILVHRNNEASLREYNIEKPLWIFIGSRVREDASDVLKIVQFLQWLLTENEETIKQLIGTILKGDSGIVADNKDVFAPRFPERNFAYLRDRKVTPDDIYDGICDNVFHVSPRTMGRKLHLVNLKNAEGEIGLRAGSSEKYFGAINIGEKSEFLKLVSEKARDILVENAALSRSLFDYINDPDSRLNVLIGAKKFIEGWNSWRVSNMCLLNVGKSKGPQIIQLFGRGVRLKGKGYDLKRSRFVPPPHPSHVEILETLQVFGVRANYMEIFKEIIEREDLPSFEIPLETKKFTPFPPDLQIIGIKGNWSFGKELLTLEAEEEVQTKVDLLPRVTIVDGREDESLVSSSYRTSRTIKNEVLDLLDWDEIFYAVLDHKKDRGLFNIAISKHALRRVMYECKYTLLCNEDLIELDSFESIA